MGIWTILGIRPTRDAAKIKSAYAGKARHCHPEEDPQGFRELHEAYLEALADARAQSGPPPARGGAARSSGENLRRISRNGASAPPPEGGAEQEAGTPPWEEAAPGGFAADGAEREGLRFSGNGEAAAEAAAPQGGLHFSATLTAPSAAPANSAHGEQESSGGQTLRFPVSNGAAAGAAPPPEGLRFPATLTTPGAPVPSVAQASGAHGGQGGGGGQALRFPADAAEGSAPASQGPPSAAMDFSGARGSAGHDPPRVEHSGDMLLFMDMSPSLDGGMPLLPLPFAGGGLGAPMAVPGAASASFPQTRQAAEREERLEYARKFCLRAIRDLAGRSHAEQDWFALFYSEEFALTACRRDFVADILQLCRQSLPLEMAQALYMGYGFASSNVLRDCPGLVPLYRLLQGVLRLPQSAAALPPLAEVVRQCELVLAGLERLDGLCRIPYVWQQALQSPAFLLVRHQPYFLDMLTRLCAGPASESLKTALAQAYGLSSPSDSPCLLPLAALLPPAPATPWAAWNPLAENLLRDGPERLLAHLRENILDLLAKTRKGFGESARRAPWDFVFAKPEFAAIRTDPIFLEDLAAFLEQDGLPQGLWPAVAEAYAPLFALLPDSSGPEPAPEQAAGPPSTWSLNDHLAQVRAIVARRSAAPPKRGAGLSVLHFLARHPVILGGLLLYCAAAAYAATVEPLLGGGMFLLLTLLLFF